MERPLMYGNTGISDPGIKIGPSGHWGHRIFSVVSSATLLKPANR